MASFGRSTQTVPRTNPVRADGQRPGDGRPYAAIREKVQRRLLADLSPAVEAGNVDEVRRAIERIFAETLAEEQVPLSRGERAALFEQMVADILGYGPIEPLLRDESVTEVLINGPYQVYMERDGLLEETDIRLYILARTNLLWQIADLISSDARTWVHLCNSMVLPLPTPGEVLFHIPGSSAMALQEQGQRRSMHTALTDGICLHIYP